MAQRGSKRLGVHHYVYDHKGERVMKSSVMHSSVQINDQNIDDIEYLEPYTLYINPYYVVTELKEVIRSANTTT